jgi:hypothetical protein
MDSFDAVLGARRGSMQAQAQRDAEEAYERERTLARWMSEVSQGGACTQALAEFYDSKTGTSASYSQLFATLTNEVHVRDVKELVEIVKHGDPVGYTGLTAPAITFLAQFFQWPPPWLPDDGDSGAAYAIDHLFFGEYEHAHYQRLLPICHGVAALIANKSAQAGQPMCRRAATCLRTAPVEALAGPLASWVKAFGQRIDNDRLSQAEREVLQSIISDQVLVGGIVPAFAALAQKV